jgi:hypothetical protein
MRALRLVCEPAGSRAPNQANGNATKEQYRAGGERSRAPIVGANEKVNDRREKQRTHWRRGLNHGHGKPAASRKMFDTSSDIIAKLHAPIARPTSTP